ncbi:MAG: hypothetical protein HFE04_01935 [Bacilli bacterium]|nr:hypothetical protein [Bacilli bacterium]
MTKEHLKITIIIIIIILLIITRAWILILDTVVNIIKKILKKENVSEHKWHIKK